MDHSLTIPLPYISGLLLAGAPWLVGVASAVAVTRTVAPKLPSYALAAGIGGYVGYLSCASLSWVLGVELRLWWLCLALALAYIAGGLVGYGLLRSGSRVIGSHGSVDIKGWSRETCLLVIFISILLALLAFISFYQVTNLPTQGWDVLDFWAGVSRDFVLYSQQSFEADFLYAHRHPPTPALIAAWAPMTASALQLPSYPYLAWFLLWLSLGLVIYGFARMLDLKGSMSLLICSAAMTMPLVEMHVYTPGYAELLILLSVVSSSAVIALSLDKFNGYLMCVGILLAASVMLLKNIGPFYFLVLIAPLLLVSISKCSAMIRSVIAVGVFLLGLLLWYAWRNHLSISFGGNIFGFDWREGFLFGGWYLTLVWPSVEDIAAILSQAWFLNLSFSTSISLFLLVTYYSFLIAPVSERRVSHYLILCFFVGFCGTVTSFFTDYGLRYAMPESDTGNSRFSMPLVPILFLAISSVVRLEKKETI